MSHLLFPKVVAWSKDFLPVAAAAGIFATGALKILGVETKADHDADIARLERDRAEQIDNLSELDAQNEHRLDRIEILLQCLLWEVPPARCSAADPNPPVKEP